MVSAQQILTEPNQKKRRAVARRYTEEEV